MPTPILHHYPISPFAEKARLLLGFKGLAWQSVLVPAVAPKPDVEALTGGYRKTPVLQIGADVYCDTALITEVLDALQPQPALWPLDRGQQALARVLAQWADTTLFWTAMAYNFQPKGVASLFEGAPPEVAQAFATDRAAMSSGMVRLRAADAAAAYRQYLQQLADALSGRDFLCGHAPCAADFCAYHPLWFTRERVPVLAGILQPHPVLLAWMDRMAAIGHGTSTRLSAADALAQAREHTPAALPASEASACADHRVALGDTVQVHAESFGPEPSTGELVAASATRWTLRREDPRAGTVHVHFPRVGYVLKRLSNP